MENRDFQPASSSPLTVARSAGGGLRLEGYAAKTGVRSELLDGFYEELARGIFTESLKRKSDVLLLFNHQSQHPLARTNGTLTLYEDSTGLRFEATLPNTALAHDIHELVRSRILPGMSFSFTPKEVVWRDSREDFPTRVVTELTLWEISVVATPAYRQTTVDARGEQVDAAARAIDRFTDAVVEAASKPRVALPQRQLTSREQKILETAAWIPRRDEIIKNLRERKEYYDSIGLDGDVRRLREKIQRVKGTTNEFSYKELINGESYQ